MAISGYKNISRIDQPKKHHHGWYVRVTWNKRTTSKFFSDKGYNSKARALEAAIAYRNQVEQDIGKPRSERQVVARTRASNTGVRGIRRTKSTRRKGGKTYSWEVYQVTYHPAPGVVKRTSVSIQKYGEQEAFRKACAIRHAAEQKYYRVLVSVIPSDTFQGIAKRYLKTKPKCRVTFRLSADTVRQAKTVHLAGEFNDWHASATPLKRQRNGDFTGSIMLDVGRSYQYRYLLDGSTWLTDPNAEQRVMNTYGTENSVIDV